VPTKPNHEKSSSALHSIPIFIYQSLEPLSLPLNSPPEPTPLRALLQIPLFPLQPLTSQRNAHRPHDPLTPFGPRPYKTALAARSYLDGVLLPSHREGSAGGEWGWLTAGHVHGAEVVIASVGFVRVGVAGGGADAEDAGEEGPDAGDGDGDDAHVLFDAAGVGLSFLDKAKT
jgi:hypothetical protein